MDQALLYELIVNTPPVQTPIEILVTVEVIVTVENAVNTFAILMTPAMNLNSVMTNLPNQLNKPNLPNQLNKPNQANFFIKREIKNVKSQISVYPIKNFINQTNNIRKNFNSTRTTYTWDHLNNCYLSKGLNLKEAKNFLSLMNTICPFITEKI